jgi:hypothetical protein
MKTTTLALLAFTALQILAARAEEKPAAKPAPDQEITVAEGSYLEPDTQNGMGYLEAVRDVFGATQKPK